MKTLLPTGPRMGFLVSVPGRAVLLGGLAAGAVLLAVCGWRVLGPRAVPMTGGALPQQAYLWQRQWTGNVRVAVEQVGSGRVPLTGLCVAYAEIGSGAGVDAPPGVQRTANLDWTLLARCGLPVGAAVRVRAFSGEVAVAREPFPTLVHVIGELCAQASAASLRLAEIQIDFDCPTSRLRGFASWLRALEAAFPTQTFRFTALPAWLRSADFTALAGTARGIYPPTALAG